LFHSLACGQNGFVLLKEVVAFHRRNEKRGRNEKVEPILLNRATRRVFPSDENALEPQKKRRKASQCFRRKSDEKREMRKNYPKGLLSHVPVSLRRYLFGQTQRSKMKHRVNFTFVLRKAFTLVYPKSVKNTVKSSVSFYAFGIWACKICMLNVDEIEP